MESFKCIGAQNCAAKAFSVSAAAPIALFAFPTRILQGALERFKTTHRR
jgi:hypothetical protein